MEAFWYLLCSLAFSHCQSPDIAGALPSTAEAGGQRLMQLTTNLIDEASGIAASNLYPETLWLHNDSGNAAEIFAISNQTGTLLRTVKIRKSEAIDWEDIASYQFQKKPWLLLADTGDNRAQRDYVSLIAILEPKQQQTALLPEWKLNFRYEDGPRDCEAVAVDSSSQSIWLLSKRDNPPRLYRLELPDPKAQIALGEQIQTARFVGEVSNIPAPTKQDLQESPWFGKYRDRPTAMDISGDGRQLLITTPKDSYLYRRNAQMNWADALKQAPLIIDTPQLAQTEGGTFNQHGTGIWVVSEQLPTQLYYSPLTQ